MKRINYFFLIVLLTIFSACSENKFKIDVSNIDVKLQIQRFDKDLYTLDPKNLITEVPILEEKYPIFFELYTTQVLQIGSTSERDFFFRMQDFLTHPDWSSVYKDVNDRFNDLSKFEQQLILAFKHYKYYYPKKQIPEIYTCMSGFNYAVFTDEKVLGIGLDFYLGKNATFYEMAQFPQYQRYNMEPERMIVDCVQAIALTDFQFNDSVSNLMAQVIHNGKIQYFMHALMPEAHDTLLFGYTPLQLKWASSYESKIWAYMVEQKHLFTDDDLIIRKYIEPAPFTSYFTNNSAPRLGVYVGWCIVQSFMENNSDVTLQDLMAMTDYNYILTMSSYNP